MDKELKSLPMEIYTKESILEVSRMDMVNTTGKMEVTSKVTLKMECDKVTVCGKKVQELVINTKDSI